MTEPTVLCEINEHGVALIKLNRAKALNALNVQLKVELWETINRVATDNHVRAVVITGEGRGFCAGGDIKEMDSNRKPFTNREKMRAHFHQTIMAIHNMEKPVIMAVNGFAVGAGFNFALSGDIILASDQAQFSQIFVQVGLIPDGGGFYFLPRLIGMPKAKELVFRGKMITAEEAEKLGLINRVVPHDQLLSEAMALANELAQGPTKAIGLAKTMLHESAEMDLQKALNYEALAQAVTVQTDDHKEGIQAFAEKRKPKFTGQ